MAKVPFGPCHGAAPVLPKGPGARGRATWPADPAGAAPHPAAAGPSPALSNRFSSGATFGGRPRCRPGWRGGDLFALAQVSRAGARCLRIGL